MLLLLPPPMMGRFEPPFPPKLGRFEPPPRLGRSIGREGNVTGRSGKLGRFEILGRSSGLPGNVTGLSGRFGRSGRGRSGRFGLSGRGRSGMLGRFEMLGRSGVIGRGGRLEMSGRSPGFVVGRSIGNDGLVRSPPGRVEGFSGPVGRVLGLSGSLSRSIPVEGRFGPRPGRGAGLVVGRFGLTIPPPGSVPGRTVGVLGLGRERSGRAF
jgi:hypothetical protein